MPKQLELITRPGLLITPQANRSAPRLWVRRLVVWEAPGGTIIRDVPLRPGLNIIWSPDPADRDAQGHMEEEIGHGSGKTLFCRLLRYCLGEERFAPDVQRDHIGTAFPEGIVGAEVILDGVCWAIIRPLGHRRRHMAVSGGDLETVASGDGAHTGMEPFIDAMESAFLTGDISTLIPGTRDRRGWLTALAWLSRDQECRFDDVLDWRAAISGSESPARGLGRTETLDALRVFLQAITPAEYALRMEIAQLEEERKRTEQTNEHRKWEVLQTRARLLQALGLQEDAVPQGPLGIEALRKSAEAKLASAANVPDAGTADIEKVRKNYDAARTKAEELSKRIGEIDALIPVIERMISNTQAEFSPLSYAAHEAENPVCKICEVPIDRVLAEGCKLSYKLPNLENIKQRHERLAKQLADEQKQLSDLQQERPKVVAQEKTARQQAIQLQEQLRALEKSRDTREITWYAARRLADDVARFAELLELQSGDGNIGSLATKIEQKRGQVGALRDDQARVFQRLTQNFDAIIRRLVGANSEGRVALTGNGLELSVLKGGDRSTAAIDSLKILAFDIAALCLSIEGATRVPAFLIHDSPREADLGTTPYYHLLRLPVALEAVSDAPQFQYIVTTTTRPPDDLLKDPWLRLTLRGAPAQERLLQRDL